MDLKSGVLNMVATDTRRLAVFKIDTGSEKDVKCLLPYKLLNLFKNLERVSGEVEVNVGKNQASFKFDNVLIISQLMDVENFPDYEKVIPEPEKMVMYSKIERKYLLNLLKKATKDMLILIRVFC